MKAGPRHLNRFFNEESPFNIEIDKASNDKKLSAAEVLMKKLEVCGQFCFILKKFKIQAVSQP
jgi:hypothetical protein